MINFSNISFQKYFFSFVLISIDIGVTLCTLVNISLSVSLRHANRVHADNQFIMSPTVVTLTTEEPVDEQELISDGPFKLSLMSLRNTDRFCVNLEGLKLIN